MHLDVIALVMSEKQLPRKHFLTVSGSCGNEPSSRVFSSARWWERVIFDEWWETWVNETGAIIGSALNATYTTIAIASCSCSKCFRVWFLIDHWCLKKRGHICQTWWLIPPFLQSITCMLHNCQEHLRNDNLERLDKLPTDDGMLPVNRFSAIEDEEKEMWVSLNSKQRRIYLLLSTPIYLHKERSFKRPMFPTDDGIVPLNWLPHNEGTVKLSMSPISSKMGPVNSLPAVDWKKCMSVSQKPWLNTTTCIMYKIITTIHQAAKSKTTKQSILCINYRL